MITTIVDPKDVKTLSKMAELLQPSGLTKINDGIMVKVKDMKGPLEEGYEKQLEQFANILLRSK